MVCAEDMKVILLQPYGTKKPGETMDIDNVLAKLMIEQKVAEPIIRAENELQSNDRAGTGTARLGCSQDPSTCHRRFR